MIFHQVLRFRRYFTRRNYSYVVHTCTVYGSFFSVRLSLSIMYIYTLNTYVHMYVSIQSFLYNLLLQTCSHERIYQLNLIIVRFS